MAQTGYTPILIYSSSTASNTPLAANLTNSALGSELAINIADGKLFYKDSGGTVQVIGWKTVPTTAGGTGLTTYTAGDTLYYASGTTLSKLGIGSSGYYMSSSGTAPQWSAPAALTKSDDTNVTLTLGGSASTALLNAASITAGWTGLLSIARGGTNSNATPTAGGVGYGTGAAHAYSAAGSSGQALLSGGAGAPTFGTLGATAGGTGLTSATTGDLIYASGANTWANLADVATGNALISGGVGVAPSWGKIGLTTHVSGTLVVSNGGTGASTLASGAVLYGNGTSPVQASANLTFDGNNLFVNSGYLSLSDANSLGKITSVPITLTGAGGGGTGGQTVNIATSGTFLGFLTITSTQNDSAIFFVGWAGGSTSLLISQTSGNRYSATSGNGNTANIYVSGSNLVLENNIQATRNFYVTLTGKM